MTSKTRPKKTKPAASTPRRASTKPKAASANKNETCFPWHVTHLLLWEADAETLRTSHYYPTPHPLLELLFGSDEPTAQAWSRQFHPLDQTRVKAHFANLTPAFLPAEIDYRMLDLDGSVRWVRHTTTEIFQKDRRPTLRSYVRDIQREKELENEVLDVSEREQNRIGQDLHDDLCQVLAGISCLMTVAQSRIVKDLPAEADNLKELNQHIVEAMERTRALTHGLFPGKIQLADIRGALLELAAQIRTRFNREVKTVFSGRFSEHTRDQITHIYRIAQEAIHNAIRHGQATEITLSLIARSDHMQLSVADNGTGLPPTRNPQGGIGTHIMQHRAQILGGTIAINNQSAGGVLAMLAYPRTK